jgi:hypothetical protein
MRARNLRFIAAAIVLAVALPSFGQVRTTTGFDSAIHGVPPSVSSFGFGGQPGFHGVPASVTSLGFGSPGFTLNRPFRVNRPLGIHHRRNFASPFFGDIVAVPYAYPVYVMEPGVDDSMENAYEYRGGPTIFDRRGTGEDYRRSGEDYRRPQPRDEEDYRPRASEETKQQPLAEQPATEKPVPQKPTVLVFKDGHQSEVLNYAIVGETLYELSEGRSKKVALAELDLSATERQNDERGVDFRVPAGIKAN